MKQVKRTAYLILIVAFAVTCFSLSSCKKDDDDAPSSGSGFPRTVSIEYKVIPSAGISSGLVIFNNSTGAYTTLTSQSLPYSTKFNRTIAKVDDYAQLGVTVSGSGTVTLEIYVNNALVKSAAPSGNGGFSGSTEYYFK